VAFTVPSGNAERDSDLAIVQIRVMTKKEHMTLALGQLLDCPPDRVVEPGVLDKPHGRDLAQWDGAMLAQ
jgi:hypothetical protein